MNGWFGVAGVFGVVGLGMVVFGVGWFVGFRAGGASRDGRVGGGGGIEEVYREGGNEEGEEKKR